MDPFYRRHKRKVIFTLVLFILGVIALIINQIVQRVYTPISYEANLSFWTAAILLLASISMGMFLMVLEYIQVHKK